MSDTPPADWYPDPAGSDKQRYWNGQEWTAHLRDTPTPAVQAWGAEASAPYPPATTDGAASPYGNPANSAYGDPSVDPYSQGSMPQDQPPAGQPYGQPQGQPYDQPYGQPQGQPYGQPYGQGYGQPQGNPYAQPYGEPSAPGYGQQPYPPAPGYAPAPGYPSAPYGQLAPGFGGPTTPDGVPLASWWARVGAYILDGLLTTVVTWLLGWPWTRSFWAAFQTFMDDTVRAAEQGQAGPTSADFAAAVSGDLLAISFIGLVFGFIYHGVMLTRWGATLGKLALGIEVRLWDRPGNIGWGTFAARWAMQFGVSALDLLGRMMQSVRILYTLIDYLFPLWDKRRQTIHDKVAKTVVVRSRD